LQERIFLGVGWHAAVVGDLLVEERGEGAGSVSGALNGFEMAREEERISLRQNECDQQKDLYVSWILYYISQLSLYIYIFEKMTEGYFRYFPNKLL
jgi:hypothetical protein